MNHVKFLIAIAGAPTLLFLAASPVEAAKGVKSGASSTGTHTVSGIVRKVTPDKSGYGVFELKSSYNHKKSLSGTTSTSKNSNQQTKMLNVTSGTMFEHHAGGSTNMVTAAALHTGQRVTVKYTGQHADQVHIYTSSHMSGRHMGSNFSRHRASAYLPHVHHHARR